MLLVQAMRLNRSESNCAFATITATGYFQVIPTF